MLVFVRWNLTEGNWNLGLFTSIHKVSIRTITLYFISFPQCIKICDKKIIVILICKFLINIFSLRHLVINLIHVRVAHKEYLHLSK